MLNGVLFAGRRFLPCIKEALIKLYKKCLNVFLLSNKRLL